MSDQVRHKPGCTTTEDGWGLKTLDLGRKGIVAVAETKASISCAFTAKLVCAFVFAFAKFRFSYDGSYMPYCCFRHGAALLLFQVFDAFIVITSFILDVIFLDSRWYETGKDATTILVLLLPWRVVRIVNSKPNNHLIICKEYLCMFKYHILTLRK